MGWGVLDAANLTLKLTAVLQTNKSNGRTMDYRPASRQDLAKYWDRYHFQPWVYNLLNAAFIFSLCKSTPLGTVQSPGHTKVDVQFSSDCKVTEFEFV